MVYASKLRFGRYWAKVVVVYNNGQSDIPTTAMVSFWVVPWKFIGIGLLILILVMVGIIFSAGSTIKSVRRRGRKRRKATVEHHDAGQS